MINFNPNLQPNETGNANDVKVVSMPIFPLALLRYEAMANFYTKEPALIDIQVREGDDLDRFEQIFRLRFWLPNEGSYSWCIYSNIREWLRNLETNLIIRHALWKRRIDLAKCMEYRSQHKVLVSEHIKDPADPLHDWPSMELKNTYLKPHTSLIDILLDIDNILLNEVHLEERDNRREIEWLDIEVMRLFDWGTMHLVWNSQMQNQQLESAIDRLHETMKSAIEMESHHLYQMVLNYSLPPRVFKMSTECDLSEASIEVP